MSIIFFEGIAGSGKTTTGVRVGQLLADQGIGSRVLKEVDKDNPFVLRAMENDGDAFRHRVLNKWDEFVKGKIKNHRTWLMDGSLFQHTTNVLVFLDYPIEAIQSHIEAIIKKVGDHDPKLIYFHGDDVRTEVKRVLNERGDPWISNQIETFKDSPFGIRYKDDPVEGFHCFFEEIVRTNQIIIDQLKIDVLKLNKSSLQWEQYEQEILDFIGA